MIINYFYEKKELSGRIENRLDRITAIAGINLNIALFNFDEELVKNMVNSVFLDPSTIYAEVESFDHIYSYKKTAKEYKNSKYDNFKDGGNFHKRKITLFYGDEKIGFFYIVISERDI